MLKSLYYTESNIAGTIARLALGIVILPHGLQKLLGMFGGMGFEKTMDFFVNSGIPAPLAFLVIMAESLGAISLIIGFLARFSAFAISLEMLVAVFMVHLSNGFFMNWYGNQQGEGFEYHILAIGLGLIVMLVGAGRFSLDLAFSSK